MRDIGERLQARARELGMSDTEVARRLGLAQGRYSNYVNGTREPDLATFARICRELSLTPNELLGFDTGEDGASSGMRARLEQLLTTFEQRKLELALALLTVVATHGDRPVPVEEPKRGDGDALRAPSEDASKTKRRKE